MIYALYIEQKITIFALYTKHKYKNQINNLTMENELQVIGTKEVEERIIELRGQKILLDRDVAELYKTETLIYYIENFIIMNMPAIGRRLFKIRRGFKKLKR